MDDRSTTMDAATISILVYARLAPLANFSCTLFLTKELVHKLRETRLRHTDRRFDAVGDTHLQGCRRLGSVHGSEQTG